MFESPQKKKHKQNEVVKVSKLALSVYTASLSLIITISSEEVDVAFFKVDFNIWETFFYFWNISEM